MEEIVREEVRVHLRGICETIIKRIDNLDNTLHHYQAEYKELKDKMAKQEKRMQTLRSQLELIIRMHKIS